MFRKITLEEAKKPITKDMHGKILKVGKKDFVRIVIPGMHKFWINSANSKDSTSSLKIA